MTGNTATVPVVAMGSEFLPAFAKLPKSEQNKTNAFLTKFRNNPLADGINLEKLHVSDDKLFSVRIDQKYRGIIAHQKSTGVYLLLYVANHEDAYAWAQKRRVKVNPDTQAVQVYQQIDGEIEGQPVSADVIRNDGGLQNVGNSQDSQSECDTSSQQETLQKDTSAMSQTAHVDNTYPQADGGYGQPNAGLAIYHASGPVAETYTALTDMDMRQLGVRRELVNIMMKVTSFEQLNQWSRFLSDDASAYLQLAAEGTGKDDLLAMSKGEDGLYESTPASASVHTELDHTVTEQPQDGNLRDALGSYASQQMFVVLSDDEDLRRLLDAPLEQWRVFLHPSQRRLVDRVWHGPARVLGGAGTGKTVVAMHRAKRLSKQLVAEQSNDQILFTTFTSNLATDIRTNLRQICSVEEMKRIEVVNLDKWVSQYLAGKGYPYAIEYDDEAILARWKRVVRESDVAGVLEFAPSFYRDEWERVVQEQGVTTAGEYLRVLRKGRGTRLSRVQKVGVWKVMEGYRSAALADGQCDKDMVLNMVAGLLHKDGPQYRHVIVDEAQDLSAPAYRVLRALVGEHDDDMFIVGDAKQRIYGRPVVLSRCGISVTGRARRLKINYRTTEGIRAAAEEVFDSSSEHVADSIFDLLSETSEHSYVNIPVEFDDLDGGNDEANDSRSLVKGPRPEVRRFGNTRDEHDYVAQWIAELCGSTQTDENENRVDSAVDADAADGTNAGTRRTVDPRDVCVVARTKRLRDEWVEVLESTLPYGVCTLERNQEDERSKPGVRVATMHRVKGLEFGCVAVVDVSEEHCPPAVALQDASTDREREEIYKQERSLIYVSLTRARYRALLVGC